MVPTLDALDLALLAALLREPRRTVAALAADLGTARSTVHGRIDRLEQRGLLANSGPNVDPERLGYTVLAFVTVSVTQRRFGELAQELAAIPEVLEVHATTGTGDLHCRVVARDNHHLFDVIEGLVANPGVQRTTTLIALRELVTYRVGPLVDQLRSTGHGRG
jgi:DNA-binding Lrp family transcriptional regulator